jgi:hypothetical protein
MPAVQPAGSRHRPAATSRDLLDTPVDEASLVSTALAEVGLGAAWVKVIADFPDLAAGIDAEATYQAGAIARVVAAATDAGARVAVHSTVPGTGQLVSAGVDSIEHGWSGLDEHAVTDLAGRVITNSKTASLADARRPAYAWSIRCLLCYPACHRTGYSACR